MDDERSNHETDPPSGAPEDAAAEGETRENRTEEMPPDTRRSPRRLLRSRTDRMVAGVAGGLGRYFGVDPVIFRIAFAVSIFFGGLGLIAYAALVIFVPSADGDGVKAAPYERSRWLGIAAGVVLALLVIPALGGAIFWDGGWGWGPWGLLWTAVVIAFAFGLYALYKGRGSKGELRTSGGRTAATVFMVALAVLVFPVLTLAAVFATATGHGVAAAITVAAIGLVLVITAFAGGARWLIVPAAALALGVGVAAAADLDFPASIGEREYTPAEASSIPAGGYELGIGHLLVDLRDIDWTQQQVVNLDVNAGIGQVDVVVPSDVCVSAHTHVGAGELLVTGERNSGADVDADRYLDATATPRLELTAELDIGQLRVINDDSPDLSGHHFHFNNDGDLAGQRTAEAAACAAPAPTPTPAPSGNAPSGDQPSGAGHHAPRGSGRGR